MAKQPAPPAAPDVPPPAEVDPFAGLVPGRVVYFWPEANEARICPGPWAAIVTRVSAETPGEVTLNVQVPVATPVGVDPVRRYEKVAYAHGADLLAGRWTWISRN